MHPAEVSRLTCCLACLGPQAHPALREGCACIHEVSVACCGFKCIVPFPLPLTLCCRPVNCKDRAGPGQCLKQLPAAALLGEAKGELQKPSIWSSVSKLHFSDRAQEESIAALMCSEGQAEDCY